MINKAIKNLKKYRGIEISENNTATTISAIISREMHWTPRADPNVLIKRMAEHKPNPVAKPRGENEWPFRPLQISEKMRENYSKCTTPTQITLNH